MNREELRQAILSAEDMVIEPVPTPEWPSVDGSVFVRSLTLPERSKYLALIRSFVKRDEVQAALIKPEAQLAAAEGQVLNEARDLSGVHLVVAATCDAQGQGIFMLGDVEILAEKSWAALNRCVDAAARLNGLSKKAMETVKNDSPSVVTSASSTALH